MPRGIHVYFENVLYEAVAPGVLASLETGVSCIIIDLSLGIVLVRVDSLLYALNGIIIFK